MTKYWIKSLKIQNLEIRYHKVGEIEVRKKLMTKMRSFSERKQVLIIIKQIEFMYALWSLDEVSSFGSQPLIQREKGAIDVSRGLSAGSSEGDSGVDE